MSNITPVWGEKFSPAMATRGSWTPLDMSTVSAYPISGSGKFAQLNYIVGSELLSATIMGTVSLAGVISADLIEIENVNIHSTVSSIPLQPNTVLYRSQTIAALNSADASFAPIINTLEIYNNDPTLTVYMNYGSTTFDTLTGQGLPLQGSSYYSIDRDVSTISLGNPNISAVDVRILGHYRV